MYPKNGDYNHHQQKHPSAPPSNYDMTSQPMYPTSYPIPQQAPQMLYRPHSAPPPSYTMVQQPSYVQSAPMLPPTLPNYIYPPQVAFQQGPPPSYGVPQYPTGYCPAPPYQRQIQPMQQHVMYSDPTMQKAVFDAGARFNGKGGASMSVPPPPPGYLPNAAQIAAMQGQTVMMEKKEENFFTGGKGGGVTFW
ncbi:DAZ-associated protein 2 [Bradysia coprophila]|uniref:DAZ-associated protein 2 n=1 Tax=Bradysia coprophila TaxID=38358 RepID=UPI00187D88C2|nr:DAZ-associated protein 2 [Bradysia coprophila]